MCDFIFEHRERQRKKHFCLLRCLSAFATPIKLYFRCVFKLLPYVALALWHHFFYLIYKNIVSLRIISCLDFIDAVVRTFNKQDEVQLIA